MSDKERHLRVMLTEIEYEACRANDNWDFVKTTEEARLARIRGLLQQLGDDLVDRKMKWFAREGNKVVSIR